VATTKTLTDHELLAGLIDSREDAFTMFFERYNRTIYQFIYKYVHSSALAEDLTQEVFIKIWNSKSQLSQVQSLKGYLLITARNHTLNSLKSALRSEVAIGEVVRNFVTQRATTDEHLLNKDYTDFLKRELDKLPERTREIFRQCREEGRNYEEVAYALGISKNAIKNHMVASMKALRAAVEKELGISLVVFLAIVYRN
jgi:RNA polymerase sigma-70 factor (ECF subfamily)